MKTSTVISSKNDSEDTEVMDSSCLLGLIINNKRTSSQEIYYCLALGRVAIKVLEKIFKNDDVFPHTKIRITQATVFSSDILWKLKMDFEEADIKSPDDLL